MTEIIHNLYHMVDEQTDRQSIHDPNIKELLHQQDVLQEEIISRLGEDGREMMETLTVLNLKLEDIRDEALFRAAMRLGAQIVQPAVPADTRRAGQAGAVMGAAMLQEA